ncbi:MAG: type III secretion system translocon subunit SctE [Shewanella sp.]|nr:type III secretion system translocon subunit SctE [Shewanella sp.]
MSAVNSIKPKTNIPQSIHNTSAASDTAGIDATYQAATIPSWSKPSEFALADHMSKHSSAVSRTEADRALKKVMGQILQQGTATDKTTDDETKKEQVHDDAIQKEVMQNDAHQKMDFNQQLQDKIDQDIAQAKRTTDRNASESTHIKVDDIRISNIEKLNPQQMVMMATLLSINTFSATANANIKATKVMTDTQIFLRDKKVKDMQDKMTQTADQANKAHKAGIWVALLDWVISAAEAIYGIIKLVEGVARAVISLGADVNSYMEVASGAAYLASGVAGFVKAAAETAELSPNLSEAQKKECAKVALVAGYVQLGCEVAGLAVDIMQGGLAFKAARGAVKGIKAGAEAAAPELVKGIADVAAKSAEEGTTEAVELGVTGAKQALKEISKEIAEQVSEELGESIAENITSKVFKEAVENGGSKIVKKAMTFATDSGKYFGKKAIREMTEKVVQDVVDEAVKKAVKKGVQATTEDLVKAVGKNATKQVLKRAMKMGVKMGIHMLQGVVQGGGMITQGTIKEIQAVTQKSLDLLSLETEFLEYTYDWYERTKSDETKSAKSLVQKETTALQGATQSISETGSIQARIASSIV